MLLNVRKMESPAQEDKQLSCFMDTFSRMQESARFCKSERSKVKSEMTFKRKLDYNQPQ